MAFDDIVIRLAVDASGFRKGVTEASAEIQTLNTRAKESAAQFTAVTGEAEKLQEETAKITATNPQVISDAEAAKVSQTTTEVAGLTEQVTALKEAANTPLDLGIDTAKLQADIQNEMEIRNQAAAGGNWAGVTESNKSLGYMQAQLNTINTVGLKDGQKEWQAYAKEMGIATETGEAGMDSMLNMGKKALGALGIAFGAAQVLQWGKAAVQAGQESLQSFAQLQRSLNGNEFAAQRLKRVAGELRNTLGVSDEAVMGLMAFQAAQGRTEQMIEKTVKAAYDFAAVTGKDVGTAVMQLDMTMEGMLGRMAKFDTRLKDLSIEELKNGAAVDLIGAKYAGMAAAMADVGTNKLNIVREKMGELTEALGIGIIESELFQTALRGLGAAADYLMPKEKALSDIYQDERIHVNALAKELMSAQTPLERRQQIMEELQQIYPDVVAGIDAESVSTELLTQNLKEYNAEMLKAIGLQFQKEKLTEVSKTYYEALTKLTKLEEEARTKVERIFGNKAIQAKVDLQLQKAPDFETGLRSIVNDAQSAARSIKGLLTPAETKVLTDKYGTAGVKQLATMSKNIWDELGVYVQKVQNTYADGAVMTTGVVEKSLVEANQAVRGYQASVDKEFTTMAAVTAQFGDALGKLEEKRNITIDIEDSQTVGEKISKLQKGLADYAVWQAQLTALKKKAKPTEEEALTIAELEEKIRGTNVDAIKKELAAKTQLQTAIEKETAAVVAQNTIWEEYAAKIETANKVYLNYLATRGIDDPATLKALERLKQLEDEQTRLQKVTEYVKKYGIEWYNQVNKLETQFNAIPNAKELQLQMGFDWSANDGWDKVAEQLNLRMVEMEERYGVVDVTLHPEYKQWLDLYMQIKQFTGGINNEIKTARQTAEKDEETAFNELRTKRMQQFGILQAQNAQFANALAQQPGALTPPDVAAGVAPIVMPIITPGQWTDENEKQYQFLLGKHMAKARETAQKLGVVVKQEGEANAPNISILGTMFGLDDEKLDAELNKVTGQATQLLQTLVNQYVEAQKHIVDTLNQRISEQEHLVQVELELNKKGEANNLAVEKDKLKKLKIERDAAQRDQEKAMRAQMALQSVLQISNLVTAASEQFKANSKMGWVGIVLAIAGIAAMMAQMSAMKQKATSLTSMRTGGSTVVDKGRTHEAGGVPIPEAGINIEQGEGVHILSRPATRKYQNVMAGIVQAANNGTLDTKMQIMYGAQLRNVVRAYVAEVLDAGQINAITRTQALSQPNTPFAPVALNMGEIYRKQRANYTQPPTVPNMVVATPATQNPAEVNVTMREHREVKEIRDMLQTMLGEQIHVTDKRTVIKTGNTIRTIVHES